MHALVILVLALVVGGLYLEDVLSEPWMGALFGLVVVGVGCWNAWRTLRAHAPLTRDVVATVLVLLVGVAACWPLAQSLFPTNELVAAEFHEEGDEVAVNTTAGGEGRLLVQAHSAGNGASKLNLTWMLGEERLQSHLHRDLFTGRVGRRGRGTMVREHASEYVRVALPDHAATLQLTSVNGGLSGNVHAALYRSVVPFAVEVGAAGLVWLLVAFVAGRRGIGPKVSAGAGAVLVFGLMTTITVTPYAAFKPELGALFVGVFVGGLGGAIVGAVIQHFVERAPAAPASPAPA